MKSVVTACEKVVSHLSMLCKKNNTKSLLLSVKGGGCNGLKYSIKPFFSEKEKYDEVINFGDFDIIVCGKSLMYLMGVKMSWNEDLLGSGIIFENPNANSKCGCGETFSIK
tara:strand:+ start:7461 stop:7793 length:333 start_codon:yes stop_codon:yes gene_type:complete